MKAAMAWPSVMGHTLSGQEKVFAPEINRGSHFYHFPRHGNPAIALMPALMDHDRIRDTIRQLHLEGCYTIHEAKSIIQDRGKLPKLKNNLSIFGYGPGEVLFNVNGNRIPSPEEGSNKIRHDMGGAEESVDFYGESK